MDNLTPHSTRTIGAFDRWAKQHLPAAAQVGARAVQEGRSAPPSYMTPDERRAWREGFYGFAAVQAPTQTRAGFWAKLRAAFGR